MDKLRVAKWLRIAGGIVAISIPLVQILLCAGIINDDHLTQHQVREQTRLLIGGGILLAAGLYGLGLVIEKREREQRQYEVRRERTSSGSLAPSTCPHCDAALTRKERQRETCPVCKKPIR